MATTFRSKKNHPLGVGTLNTAIDDNDLAIVLDAGQGAAFPSSNFTISIDEEIILIDSRSTDTLTVNASGRGYDSSTASAHAASVAIANNQIVKDFTDLETAINGIENGTTTLAGLAVSGESSIVHTETGVGVARPVSMTLTFRYAPSGTPGMGIDHHGVDLVGYSDDSDVGASVVSIYPFESQALYEGTGDLEGLVPMYALAQNTNIGTVDWMWLLRLWAKNTSTGTVTDLYGVKFENPVNSGGGTITNIHAIHIEDVTVGSVENFGIYSLAPNYMAELGIANGGAALNSYLEVGGSSGSSNYNTYLKGGAATSGTWALMVHNSAGNSILSCRNDRLVTARQLEVSTTSLFNGNVTVADAINLIFNTTTGSKIGTATTQKIGFWNVTPIVQPASANQAALSLDVDVTGGDTVDKSAIDANFTSIQTLVNQLRSDLVAAGLIKGAA